MNKKKKRGLSKNSPADKLCIILLCAPAILHLLIFWLGVQIETFRMAFTNVDTGEFTVKNFEWAANNLFNGASSYNMPLLFKNTMIFFAMGCAMVPISMFFAYLIYRRTFGHSFMRLALYLPGAVSSIMMGLLYIKLMESQGPLMQLIQRVSGRKEPIFMLVTYGVVYILIFDVFVGIGSHLVIWLGGMSRIPYDLIEYGKLEGIKPIREFRSVILPLIWPTFVTMISLQIINLFGASGSVLLLSGGAHGTNTLAYWMYQMVLENHTQEFNHVAALGMIFTIITIPIVIVCRTIMNRFGEEVEY